MNFVSLTDLIRPVGSVFFSSLDWNFNPTLIFGGTWVQSGVITEGQEAFNVWHRLT